MTVNEVAKQLESFVNATGNNKGADMAAAAGEYLPRVTNLYVSADEVMRQAIRDIIKDEQRLAILSASAQLAAKAYETKDQQLVESALALHAIEDFRWDPRENLIYLSVIWYVAEKLSVDAAGLFAAIASVSSARAAGHLREFAERPGSLKTPGAMGLQVTAKGKKLSIAQKTPPWAK